MNALPSSATVFSQVFPSQTARVPTALGAAFVTLIRDPQGQPLEVLLNLGKAGTDTCAVAEALGRLISLILRMDSPVSHADRVWEIVGQLARIGAVYGGGGQPSLPDALAGVLSEFLCEPGPATP